MTEALTPPAAGSPLALLFDIAATAHLAPRFVQDEERELAETAAADHIYTAYPETLGQAVDQDVWTGFPAVRHSNIQPGAVAHLDGGLWLHHTITANADYRDALTLLAPCICGHGYVSALLEDENDLLELLNELRVTGGRAVHSDDIGGPYCDSIPAT
ncbi:hypothetical protein [Streptomyces albovinaceus]|uniref:hypothetical protein n=1 Tax=Streptomyces albovinaceus TaxID=66867 RepID=UPI000A3C2CE7|nr:hypothetical protein [Streptomyces albovinaceus]